MSIDVTVVSNGGQVIEVSVGEGAAVLDALGSLDASLIATAAGLQTNINTEATTRSTADTAIQGNLNAEATARGAADTAQVAAIGAEVSRATSAEAGLAGAIATKVTAAEAAAAAPVQSVAGMAGDVSLVKADVGLESVDNTADADKPVSAAQGDAIIAASTALIGTADTSSNTLGKLATRIDGVKETADDLAATVEPLAAETGYMFGIGDPADTFVRLVRDDGVLAPDLFEAPPESIDPPALAPDVIARMFADPIGGRFEQLPAEAGGGFAYIDPAGVVSWWAKADGQFYIGDLQVTPAFLADLVASATDGVKVALRFESLPPESGWLYVFADPDDVIAYGVRLDGSEYSGASAVEVPEPLLYDANYVVIPSLDDDGRQYLESEARNGSGAILLTTLGTDARSPAIDGGLVSYVTGNLRYVVPVNGSAAPRQATATPKKLYVWGDSLSDTATGNSPYIDQLAALRPDVSVYHGGIAAQDTVRILARQGSQPTQVTMAGNTIPASGSIAVTLSIPLLTNNAYHIYAELSGTLETPSGSVPGRIIKDTSDAYTFLRTMAGATIACPAGTVFIPDVGRLGRRAANLIWIGRNDINTQYASVTQAGYTNAFNYNENLIPRILFVGITTLSDGSENSGSTGYNRIVAHNNACAVQFGGATWDAAGNILTAGRFFDIRRYLIECGLTVAGLTATGPDNTAIANDVIPPSLMAPDFKHLSVAGNTVARKGFAQIFDLKRWW
jgi:hypothetical protein